MRALDVEPCLVHETTLRRVVMLDSDPRTRDAIDGRVESAIRV